MPPFCNEGDWQRDAEIRILRKFKQNRGGRYEAYFTIHSVRCVNMAVASTGSIVLVENEGNIRWSTAAPPVHVAIMSLEKIVANMADGFHVMERLTPVAPVRA